MSLWTCIKCKCQAIAHGLGACPQCGRERDDMPKTTAGGGGTNAREPRGPLDDVQGTPEDPEAPEAVSEPSDPEPAVAAPKPPPRPPLPPPAVSVSPLAAQGSVTGPGKDKD